MRAIRASLLMGFAVMLLSALPSDHPWYLEGTVAVRSHSNYVVIGVAPEGGGTVEHLFVFWPVQPLPAGVKRYEKSSITFDGKVLQLTQRDAKTIHVYYVADATKPSTPTAFSATAYPGKGLSQYYGSVAARFGVSKSGKQAKSVCYIDLAVCKDKIFEID